MEQARGFIVPPTPVLPPTPAAPLKSPRRRGLVRSIIRERAAYLFLVPFAIPFVLFEIWPTINAVLISFYEERLVRRTFIGLDNYTRMFEDPVFWQTVHNTGVLMLFTVPLATGVSLAIAIVIYRFAPRLASYVRAALYLPVVASSVVIAVIWLNLLNPFRGLLNEILKVIGMEPVLWLGTTEMALNSIIIVLLSFSLGGPVILLLAGLGAIPEDLGEAARIDGASEWQEIRHVTIPLLRPALLFVLITQTIGVSQTFAIVKILTNGGPVNATQTMVFRVYNLSFDKFDFGYASAHAVMILLIVPLIAFVQYRIAGKEVSY